MIEEGIDECVICGDKAFGFNFNVLSCESCKAFFRRTASKNTELKCIFKGNCEIDLKNRKICRFCRLTKCLAFGMKKEWILSDEQRKPRKRFNKNKKSDKQNDHILKKGTISEPSIDEMTDSSIDFLISDRSDCSSSQGLNESHIDSLEDDSNDISLMSRLQMVPISRPITDYRNTLTEVEGNYLTELLFATNILKTPIGSITSEATSLYDAYHVLTSARASDIRSYVTMFKGLTAFNTITQSDRFSLIRPGFIEMFYVRTVAGYFNDNDKEYLILPTNNEKSCTCLIDFDLFRTTKPYLYAAKTDFYRKISREWDSDEIILDLLTAIVLFNPDRCRTIDRQNVRYQQQIYQYLLLRYLLIKYRTEWEANAKYWRLMNTIECLHVLFDKNRQIIGEENFLDRKKCLSLFDGLNL